jgi:hypothetical protein
MGKSAGYPLGNAPADIRPRHLASPHEMTQDDPALRDRAPQGDHDASLLFGLAAPDNVPPLSAAVVEAPRVLRLGVAEAE